MTTNSETLSTICAKIGARVEPFDPGEPVLHTVPGSDPLRSEPVTGPLMLVTYDPHIAPEIQSVFGIASDARIVGVICGPFVIMEMVA